MSRGYLILVAFGIVLLGLFAMRLFSPRHLDDLHPNIQCDVSLIEKADYLAVIPLYENVSIAENRAWCDYIKGFNKTLVLHGVYHSYQEFGSPRNGDYVQRGIDEFEMCFGHKPEYFKPPQLEITSENKNLLGDKFGLKVFAKFNQLTHKAYHCENSGRFPNWLIDLV